MTHDVASSPAPTVARYLLVRDGVEPSGRMVREEVFESARNRWARWADACIGMPVCLALIDLRTGVVWYFHGGSGKTEKRTRSGVLLQILRDRQVRADFVGETGPLFEIEPEPLE